MRKRTTAKALGSSLAAAALLTGSMAGAQAYNPTGGTLHQLGSEPCLKGRGNCAVYPKSAQLPGGRLVASFEKSTVVASSGSAAGQTLPVYKSDDDGTSWQPLSEVKAPAYLSKDPRYAKYTSNWTNPYLYVLPRSVGGMKAGTLLLASVVSSDDYYYKEHKAADPNWTPSNNGDRSDLAIALYSSTDQGRSWTIRNVVATGGWQGGSAGAVGKNIAAANKYQQVDPLWEPYLMVYKGKLVCYYSDENDCTGFDPVTGVPTKDPANDTATDSHGQILVHRTWDGRSADWSEPVVDVAGSVGQRQRPQRRRVDRVPDDLTGRLQPQPPVRRRHRPYRDPQQPGHVHDRLRRGRPRRLGRHLLPAGQPQDRPGDRHRQQDQRRQPRQRGRPGRGPGGLGAAADPDTQQWHVVDEPNGGTSLLNRSGGRAAAIWTGNATVGQRIGQWVDNSSTGSWNLVKTSDGYYRFQAVKNSALYLTGASAGVPLTLQNATGDGSQDWKLVR